MCLDVIKKILIRGKYLYKVFRVSMDGRLFSPINGEGQLRKRKWLKEELHRRPGHLDEIHSTGRFYYPKGWHCFTNKAAAKSYARINKKQLKVFRVKFKDTRKTGTQNSYWIMPHGGFFKFNCAVVGQIMILEEAK